MTYVVEIMIGCYYGLDHKGEVQKKVTNPNTPVEDALYFYENVTDSK